MWCAYSCDACVNPKANCVEKNAHGLQQMKSVIVFVKTMQEVARLARTKSVGTPFYHFSTCRECQLFSIKFDPFLCTFWKSVAYIVF